MRVIAGGEWEQEVWLAIARAHACSHLQARFGCALTPPPSPPPLCMRIKRTAQGRRTSLLWLCSEGCVFCCWAWVRGWLPGERGQRGEQWRQPEANRPAG
jgi:hypothetical protein